MRKAKAVLWSVILAVILVSLLLSLLCRHTVASMRSPDGRFNAQLIEDACGENTSFHYEVHVGVPWAGRYGPHRQLLAELYGAGDRRAYGVNVAWKDANHLMIEVLGPWEVYRVRDSVRIRRQDIFVTVREGDPTSMAPPNGVLINLERTRHPGGPQNHPAQERLLQILLAAFLGAALGWAICAGYYVKFHPVRTAGFEWLEHPASEGFWRVSAYMALLGALIGAVGVVISAGIF